MHIFVFLLYLHVFINNIRYYFAQFETLHKCHHSTHWNLASTLTQEHVFSCQNHSCLSSVFSDPENLLTPFSCSQYFQGGNTLLIAGASFSFFLFWYRISVCCSCWPWTHGPKQSCFILPSTWDHKCAIACSSRTRLFLSYSLPSWSVLFFICFGSFSSSIQLNMSFWRLTSRFPASWGIFF